MYVACERQDETDALDRAISKMTRVMKCAAPAAKTPPRFHEESEGALIAESLAWDSSAHSYGSNSARGVLL